MTEQLVGRAGRITKTTMYALSYDAFRFLCPGLIGNLFVEVNLHYTRIQGADGRGSEYGQDRVRSLIAGLLQVHFLPVGEKWPRWGPGYSIPHVRPADWPAHVWLQPVHRF